MVFARRGSKALQHQMDSRKLLPNALSILPQPRQAAGPGDCDGDLWLRPRPGLSRKKPSSVTIGARIACLSSFYRSLICISLVSANPRGQLVRPRATPEPPRGLTATNIKMLLEVILQTPVGLRHRAIVFVLILTGRRRTAAPSPKAGNLCQGWDAVYYVNRGKSGKQCKRGSPQPAYQDRFLPFFSCPAWSAPICPGVRLHS